MLFQLLAKQTPCQKMWSIISRSRAWQRFRITYHVRSILLIVHSMLPILRILEMWPIEFMRHMLYPRLPQRTQKRWMPASLCLQTMFNPSWPPSSRIWSNEFSTRIPFHGYAIRRQRNLFNTAVPSRTIFGCITPPPRFHSRPVEERLPHIASYNPRSPRLRTPRSSCHIPQP